MLAQLPYYGYNEANPFTSIEQIVDFSKYSLLGSYTENKEESSNIADRYISEFDGYLNAPITEYTFDQQLTIGGQIFGDHAFRIPAMEEIQKYAEAGWYRFCMRALQIFVLQTRQPKFIHVLYRC